MGGRVLRVEDSLAPTLKDILARLDRLERAPANVVDQLADTYTGAISQAITSTFPGTVVTGSSATVTLLTASRLFIVAQVGYGVTAGTDFGNAYIELDGVGVGRGSIVGSGPTGYYSATLIAAPLVTAGAHVVRLRGEVGAGGTTVTIVAAETWVFRLGSA